MTYFCYLGVCYHTLFHILRSKDFFEIGCITDNSPVDSFFLILKK